MARRAHPVRESYSGGKRIVYGHSSKRIPPKNAGRAGWRIIKTPAAIKTAGQKNWEIRYTETNQKIVKQQQTPAPIKRIDQWDVPFVKASSGSDKVSPI